MKTLILDLPKSVIHKKGSALFLHQEATREILLQKDLVMNTSHTGTGKTTASLLYLKDLITKNGYKTFFSVMIVSPVNMLVSQMTLDVLKFVTEKELPYHVFQITSEMLRELKKRKQEGGKELKITNADLLVQLMKDPVNLLRDMVYLMNKNKKINQETSGETRPIIYVINPDIFYYMLFGEYYKAQRKTIQLDLLKKTQYIIFDEFHYYDLFQLSAFFTLLSVWKVYGLFERQGKKICLLSATPNELLITILREKIGLSMQVVNDEWCLKQNPSGIIEEVDVLAPAKVVIHEAGVRKNFEKQMKRSEIHALLNQYLEEEKFGLVICNSRWAINKLHEYWKPSYGEKMGRITGTIKEKERKRAVEKPLLLATSTVDIGFNFERTKKSKRQSIDFLFLDFANHEELIQRVGRPGRVLGKEIKNNPSEIHLFLTRKDFTRYKDFIKDLDLTTLTRIEILETLKAVIPERTYYREFFREYGGLLAQIFLERLRTYTATNKYYQSQNEREQEKFQKQDQLEEMLYKVFGIETKQEKGQLTSRLILDSLFEKNRWESRRYEDLTEKQQRKVIANYLGSKDFRVVDTKIRENGYEKLSSSLCSCGLDPSHVFQSIWKMKKSLLYDGDEQGRQNVRKLKQNILTKNDYWIQLFYYNLGSIFSALKNEFRGSSLLPPKRRMKKNGRNKDVYLFNATEVEIYDPHEYQGSKNITGEFFKVATRYEYFLRRNEETRTHLEITAFKEEYTQVVFTTALTASKKTFEEGILRNGLTIKKCLYRIVMFPKGALSFTFQPRLAEEALPKKISHAMDSMFLALILPEKINLTRKLGFFVDSYLLEVTFNLPNGVTERETYQLVFGKDALLVSSALREQLNEEKEETTLESSRV